MDIYIGSTLVIDNYYFGDEKEVFGCLGGSGAYAFSGARKWSKDVHLICGIGEDFFQTHSDWLEANHINEDTIYIVEDKTPVNIMYFDKYRPENARPLEIPLYGHSHYSKFYITSKQLKRFCQKKCGIYIYRDLDDNFWEPYLNTKVNRATVMWKIRNSVAKPENLNRIYEIAGHVEIFVVSLNDAKQMYATNSSDIVIKNLSALELPLTVILDGLYGVYFIQDHQSTYYAYEDIGNVVDEIGSESSASGALLVGYCQELSFEEISKMMEGSIISATSQYGIPQIINPDSEG